MRALLGTLLFLCATPAWADDKKPYAEEDRQLSAQELHRYAAVYYAPIRACYLQHGRVAKGSTGELALELVVHRDGYVHEAKIVAPGVKGKQLKKLDACIQEQILAWHFPIRRDFTTAVLPYYFMYVDIPQAGPQYSCWNPKGCPTKPVKAARR